MSIVLAVMALLCSNAGMSQTGHAAPANTPAAVEPLPGEALSVWLSKPEDTVTFLAGDWHGLLERIVELGPVSVVSGNGALRHVATGTYGPYRGSDAHGLIVSEGIDLRLFPHAWTYAAAALPGSNALPGFVFFTADGTQVHRINLTPESNRESFLKLVEHFKAEKPVFTPVSHREDPAHEALSPERTAGLLDAWSALEDTHDFGRLLEEFNVSRTDALRAARGKFTEQLDPAGYTALFQKLLDGEVAMMVFATNEGCVQISTGALTEVKASPGVLQLTQSDQGHTLIRLSEVAEAWRVTKPTSNGMAHSLELYDRAGTPIAYLFPSRKGGEEGVAKWKDALFALAISGAPAAGKQAQAAPAAPASEPAAEAAPAQVDLSKLSERTRGQIERIVTRVLAFDQDQDGALSAGELPSRMQVLMAKANPNGDGQLDRNELMAHAYRQLQEKRAARAGTSASE